MLADHHLVLAGGGHTHALLLLRWAMKPNLRPQGFITVVSRDSGTLYSGMLPGLISGKYKRDEVCLNIRRLSDRIGASFIASEIVGIDCQSNHLYLNNRPAIHFDRVSIDVGSETFYEEKNFQFACKDLVAPIRPLDHSLSLIESLDRQPFSLSLEPLTVVGDGLAGLEIAFALRKRWPQRPLHLNARTDRLRPELKRAIVDANIKLVVGKTLIPGPALLCTGNRGPKWLGENNLPVDECGRVITIDTLQVVGHSNVFAVGDCAVLANHFRPPSGVWAVRAAKPLARNIERILRGLEPLSWRPQRRAMQLLGGHTEETSVAWLFFGNVFLGPNRWLWWIKEAIDRQFVEKFRLLPSMSNAFGLDEACRGCAAKLGAQPLKEALEEVELNLLGSEPEDAVCISRFSKERNLLQSVDGFPALVSDPWLNGRLTALHSCSDLWASGAPVDTAQVVITLPAIAEKLQKELLVQALSGVQSALKEQGAELIGGHTLESRSVSPEPSSLGLQIAVTVNGFLPLGQPPWRKGGLQPGDVLLISKELGSGVIFAGAMKGLVNLEDLDLAIAKLSESQHYLLDSLLQKCQESPETNCIHACTDVTGFGLLGHLGEMLKMSNSGRAAKGLIPLNVKLYADKIPSLNGALELLSCGCFSTLAPSNRKAWELLSPNGVNQPLVKLNFEDIPFCDSSYKAILELIVDPQTCGPLLISCPAEFAFGLVKNGPWKPIGEVVLGNKK